MTRKLLQSAFCLFLCPSPFAPQAAAMATTSEAAQTLPDDPVRNSNETSNWNRVGSLARGEQITVAMANGRSLHCLFAGATDDEVFCASQFSDREFRFKRPDVDRVRMDQGERHFWAIIGVGAVAVGIWTGISSTRTNDSRTAVAEGVAGAAVGALLTFIPAETVKAFHLIPGKLIYQRTKAD